MSGPGSEDVGASDRGSLLLELPVPFRVVAGALHMEAQAHNGLARWLDNFDQLSVCAPVLPEAQMDGTMDWKPVDDLLATGRLRLHPLPWGYHPRDHLRHRGQVRALFRQLIPGHRYLCFSNLGWAGAWGSLAAREAEALRRPYAVWLDWELHVAEQSGRASAGGLKGLVQGGRRRLERARSLHTIRQAALGLFHGRTVYDAYAAISRHPYVVHDVHLKQADLISDDALQARLQRTDGKVRIGYVGRVHPMKAPHDWIAAIATLASDPLLAPRLQAVWMGPGPLLEDAREDVRRRGLSHIIAFPGGESDRAKVVEFFRSLDLFVFCHNTPESPRCLLEALMAAVPLVGYDSSFARDLVAQDGGGSFAPIGDIPGLAAQIRRLIEDTALRHQQTWQTRRSGMHFSDDAVFLHRSNLIKQHLAFG